MKAILKIDVLSYNFHLRGVAGDEVEILFDHDDVKIVENDKGERFAVHETKLDYEGVLGGVNKYRQTGSTLGQVKSKRSTSKSKSNVKRRNT